jgi:hypothetical protein
MTSYYPRGNALIQYSNPSQEKVLSQFYHASQDAFLDALFGHSPLISDKKQFAAGKKRRATSVA